MDAPSPHPASREALDRLALASLPVVGGGVAAIFAVMAGLNALVLTMPSVLPVVGGNLLACAVAAATGTAARRGRVAPRHAAAAIALVHLVGIGVVLNAYRLLDDPMRAVFVSLAMVSAGWFLHSRPWLFAVLAVALAGWGVVGATFAGDSRAFGEGVFYLLASAILAFVAQRVRTNANRRLLAAIDVAEGEAARNERIAERLAESEEQLRDLVDNGGVLVQSVGDDGTLRYVNQTWARTLGYAADEATGRPIFDFIHPDSAAHCRRQFEQILATGEPLEVAFELRTREGARVAVEGTVTVRRENGRPVYTRGMLRDVTVQRRLQGELRSLDVLLRRVAATTGKVFWAYDLDAGRFSYVSGGFEALAGRAVSELYERPGLFFELFFPEDDDQVRALVRQVRQTGRVEADHRLRHRDGGERWVHMEATLDREGGAGSRHVVGVSEDITERKHKERELERLASVDPLTGLANRRRFDDALLGEWRRHVRLARPLSLLVIDVDRFKEINDEHGHAVGDECLRAVAAALGRSVQRVSDLVARIGGEEFAIVLPDTPLEGARQVAERVHAEVAGVAVTHEGVPIAAPTVSVGLAAAVPNRDAEADLLLGRADAALYAAKRAGRNRTAAAEDDDGRPTA